jgi:F-box and leucine-rich repeat protein 2/20
LTATRCTHTLLRWLIKRKMQPEVISCNGGYAARHDHSFVGIDNKSLHTLGLFKCDITDAGLLMIAQGCPQLKDITLRSCKKISDTGLLALAVNLPGMTSIDLWLTSHMTCVGVSAMTERCPALVKISIHEGGQSLYAAVVLNDSIRAIARGCPKLQTISIYYSDWLTDESVAFLAERCKELRSVCLHGCDEKIMVQSKQSQTAALTSKCLI